MEIVQGLKPGVFLRHNTYRLEKVLGQGGFGITYLAVDLNLDRYVAIKEFFPKDYCDRDDATSHVTLGTQGSKEFVNRLKAKFLKEARNIARFDNPNIIRIHAAFEENDTAYYVMDYIEGLTLAEIVRNNGPIQETKALTYINKVGNALEYVHEHNVTHLDVKPANIIVRLTDEEPILIDFGLAKQYDAKGNQTSTTPIGISHGYAPMEQYADGGIKVFSPQTDLYSLAATLYYILSGVVPPQATKLIEDELTFPQLIPANLIGPISKAMSASRRKRHESIGQFLSQLEKAGSDKDNQEGEISEFEDENISFFASAQNGTKSEAIHLVNDNHKNINSTFTNSTDKNKLHPVNSMNSPETEFTVSDNLKTKKKYRGLPTWVYGLVASIVVIACVCIFFLKEPVPENSVEVLPTPTTRQLFEQALTLMDSDESAMVKDGFDHMKVLSTEYDSARIEIGMTYFPYLRSKTREEAFKNPILKRRLLLNFDSTDDADSVIKYLGNVDILPPEAAYILGCTYYQHNDDEQSALKMFKKAKNSLDNGIVTGHGYDSNGLKNILVNNINALSK